MTSVLKVDTIQNSSGTESLTDGRLLKRYVHAWSDGDVGTTAIDYKDATGSSFTYTPTSSDSFIVIEGHVSVVSDNKSGAGSNYMQIRTRLDVDGAVSSYREHWFRFDDTSRVQVGDKSYIEMVVDNTSTANKTIKLQYSRVNPDGNTQAGINTNGGGNRDSYIVVSEYSGSVITS